MHRNVRVQKSGEVNPVCVEAKKDRNHQEPRIGRGGRIERMYKKKKKKKKGEGGLRSAERNVIRGKSFPKVESPEKKQHDKNH